MPLWNGESHCIIDIGDIPIVRIGSDVGCAEEAVAPKIESRTDGGDRISYNISINRICSGKPNELGYALTIEIENCTARDDIVLTDQKRILKPTTIGLGSGPPGFFATEHSTKAKFYLPDQPIAADGKSATSFLKSRDKHCSAVLTIPTDQIEALKKYAQLAYAESVRLNPKAPQ